MKSAHIILLLLAGSCRIYASDQALADALTEKYAGSVLILRDPVEKNELRFDETGRLLGKSKSGVWTNYGPIEIKRIDLTKNTLRIRGTRRIYEYDSRKDELQAKSFAGAAEVKVNCQLRDPIQSVEEAEKIISRIFAAKIADISEFLPDYWQLYLQKPGGGARKDDSLPAVIDERGQARVRAGAEEADRSRAPAEIIAPAAKFTPPPQYTDTARELRIEGYCLLNGVIGTDGKVHEPYIVQPIGAGLDEQAIAVVEHWEFKPATQGGRPVKVQMTLRVPFRLR